MKSKHFSWPEQIRYTQVFGPSASDIANLGLDSTTRPTLVNLTGAAHQDLAGA